MTKISTLSPFVTGSILFLISAVVLGIVIFGASGYFDSDAYYHTRMPIEIVQQSRLAVNFPWMPLTILDAARFTDHHLLYHLFLIPWVMAGGITGAKLAAVTIGAGVVAAMWLALRQAGVKWAWLWSLAVLGLSSAFLLRLDTVRTQGASLLILVIALMLLSARRYRWMLLVAFAYAWLYNGFVLLIALALVYSVAMWLEQRRLVWQPLFYTLVGIGLGLLINPYFPRNVVFALDHLLPKVNVTGNIQVGTEWYPRPIAHWIRDSAAAFLVFALGTAGYVLGQRIRDHIDYAFFLMALITLVMTLIASRFIEYFPAFALMSCAAAWGRGGDFRLPKVVTAALSSRWARLAAGIVTAALVVVYAGNALYITQTQSPALEKYDGAAAWLQANTAEGSLVFNTVWGDFPHLFYANPHNAYVAGLDPTYLSLEDPEMWMAYVSVRRLLAERPAEVVRTVFNADYLVMNSWEVDLLAALQGDPGVELVYEDAYSLIWQIASDTP